ncbi:MAG: hypothetical protein RQ767_01050 [Thermovirgaceae bacterium]|nr:hypothetical protein [Thermovirgaceae bacterium]
MKARFVKGHMGGNTIAVFNRGAISGDFGLESVVGVLNDEKLACHEAGLVSQAASSKNLCLAIAGRSSRRWISACGGLTQVLGHVLARNDLCDFLGFPVLALPETVILETEAGPTPIIIRRESGKVSVWTDMTGFLEELYRDGFEELDLCGFPVRRIGKFLVIDAKVLRQKYSDNEIETLVPGVRETLTDIQRAFFSNLGRESRDFALFDDLPKRGGDFRVVFPHYLPENHIEPACGTGTVAAGVAIILSRMSAEGKGQKAGTVEMIFESGGGPSLGGPDRTLLRLESFKDLICSAFFSHDRVEITAMGTVFLSDDAPGR